MKTLECNYQRKVDLPDLKTALSEGCCDHCGLTAVELAKQGEILEICGREFCFDYETGVATETPVALCPACHAANHLDANRQHNPCHISARRSRERLE